jgi:DNA-binding XRE family transcriptional regulator
MAKPAITKADLAERVKRQTEWREFRKVNLYSQRKLAEALEISIRCVQYVEAGRFTPLQSTLRRFEALKARLASGAERWVA